MRGYLIRLDKELLELGAVELHPEIDKAFQDSDTAEFINVKNEVRSLSLNRNEALIQGRGIIGLFRPYSSEHVFFSVLTDGKVRISEFDDRIKDCIDKDLNDHAALEHTKNVLGALCSLKQGEKKWFELYDHAGTFVSGAKEDDLVSLIHLKDIQMFQYQIKTVKAVLGRFRGRVLLCDEVGLGKTIEAGIAMMEYLMKGLVKKVLILVPPSLVDQWYYEMKRKFNQDFIRADDPDFKRKGDQAWESYSKVIASISTAKRKNNVDIINKVQYDLIIVDEAHHLKNRKTAAWQFVNSLSKKYIFLLTATPVQNNLEEIYNLITLLKPGQLKTFSYFKKNFIGDSEGLEAKNVNSLRRLLSDVMIRNKRSDVDIKFTKRAAVTYTNNLLPEEKKLYDEISSFVRKRYNDNSTGLNRFVLKSLQEEMGSSFRALAGTLGKLLSNRDMNDIDRDTLKGFLNEANDITSDNHTPETKLMRLMKIINEFGDKLIVFTKYRATQEYISGYLEKQGIEIAQFHGGLRRKDKENQISLFKESAKVLVSTESGGEGRNLQFCNGMVNYDLPWNPMAIEQRIGRIHRVGQERDVFVFNLASANTLEHYILELLDRKINMFELVVGEVDMILGDIEDESDFSDLVMNAWINAHDHGSMEQQMEIIGQKLIANKKQYQKIRDLDEKLFADTFEISKTGG